MASILSAGTLPGLGGSVSFVTRRSPLLSGSVMSAGTLCQNLTKGTTSIPDYIVLDAKVLFSPRIDLSSFANY